MKNVNAYLNHGIWKVDCPKCGMLGAVLAEAHPEISPYYAEDGKYICPRCYPGMVQMIGGKRFDEAARKAAMSVAKNAGEIYQVVFPHDKSDIEKIVSCRPVENRNWQKPETLEFLVAENKEYGVI